MTASRAFFICGLILLMALTSCSPSSQKTAAVDFKTGTEGITMNFADSLPREIVVGSTDEAITLSMEVRNRGAYPPARNADGVIRLTGFDPSALSFGNSLIQLSEASALGGLLEGKSSSNSQGGYAFFDFPGTIHAEQLSEGKYSPTLIATACYRYETTANPQVCMEKDPFSLPSQKNVCTAKDVSLASQGAPVAVTKIEQTSLSDEMQFKITFRNVGKGDVIDPTAGCSANGDAQLTRQQIGKVKVESVKAGGTELQCRPLESDRTARMIDGTGFIICTLRKDDAFGSSSSYITPLDIALVYDYKTSIEKQLAIRKVP